MNYFKKYLLVCMLPAIALGMEPDSKKVYRDERLSELVMDRLKQSSKRAELDLDVLADPESSLPTSVSQCMALAKEIKIRPTLRSVILTRGFFRQFPQDGLASIGAAIGTLPELRNLDLTNNDFGGTCLARCQSVAQMVRCARKLDSIKCGSCDFGALQMPKLKMILSALAGARLTRLDLSQTMLIFSDRTQKIMGSLQTMTHTLKSLDLRDTSLSKLEKTELSQLGLVIQGLEELNLSWNYYGGRDDDLKAFWQVLFGALVISEIKKLNMACNCLDALDVPIKKLLCQTFALMRRLETLDLHGNDLTGFGEFLVDALMRNPHHPTLIINDSDDPTGFFAQQRDRYGRYGLNIVIRQTRREHSFERVAWDGYGLYYELF